MSGVGFVGSNYKTCKKFKIKFKNQTNKTAIKLYRHQDKNQNQNMTKVDISLTLYSNILILLYFAAQMLY